MNIKRTKTKRKYCEFKSILSESKLEIYRWSDGEISIIINDVSVVLKEKEFIKGISEIPINKLL